VAQQSVTLQCDFSDSGAALTSEWERAQLGRSGVFNIFAARKT
jgi:hypothetical protein